MALDVCTLRSPGESSPWRWRGRSVAQGGRGGLDRCLDAVQRGYRLAATRRWDVDQHTPLSSNENSTVAVLLLLTTWERVVRVYLSALPNGEIVLRPTSTIQFSAVAAQALLGALRVSRPY